MAGVLGSIAVESAQSSHVLLCAQHTGDNKTVKRNTLDIEGVKESLAYIL